MRYAQNWSGLICSYNQDTCMGLIRDGLHIWFMLLKFDGIQRGLVSFSATSADR